MTHLNELAKEFGSKGLVVIALSKEAKGTIEPWLEAQGAEYPVFVDDGGATASAYGVSGIPNAALIGPDGKVAWQGHPGDLNAQMVEPVLKDCVLRFEYAFPPAFKAVEAKIAKKDYAGAVKELEKLGERTGTDGEFAKKVGDDLAGYAADKIAGAKADATGGDPLGAQEAMTELAKQYKGHPAGDQADALLKEWKADKAFTDGVKACQLVAKAKELEGKFQFAQAAGLWSQIVSKHKGTKPAEQAQVALDRITRERLLKFDPGCPKCTAGRKTCDKHRNK